MLERSVLEGLLARVREATGPDRELDAEIAKAFGWQLRLPHRYWSEPLTWTRLEAIEGLPPFTRSVDYALALAGLVVPAWSLMLGYSEGYRYPVVTMGRSYPTNAKAAAEHHTAPLAILTALLLALSQDETREGVETSDAVA